MEMRFWDDNSLQHVKFESNSNDNIPPRSREPFYCEAANLNFATGDDDCMDYSYRKTPVRVSRQDPLSHRIIEKRRRDRMNNCLADLSRLIPAEYLKKGRGRVEKTEIIEMAIKHMKYLQYMNHYRLGYQECMSEAMRFLVEVEGRFPREPTCVRLLGHLQAHCDNICRGTGDAPGTTGSGQSCPTGQIPSSVDKVEPKVEPNNNYDEQQESMQGMQDCGHDTNGYDMGVDADKRIEDVDVEVDVGTEKREDHILHEDGHDVHSHGYKYKNDIKLRFTQDNAKNPISNIKVIGRRNSTPISTDNQTCIGSPTPATFIESTIAPIKPTPANDDHMIATPWTLSTGPPPNPTAVLFSSNGTSAFSSPLLRKPTPLNVKLLTNGVNGTHGITNGHGEHVDESNFLVPAFVLHTKGSFYVPMTFDYHSLIPHLNGGDLLTAGQDVVLHPVAINVNFQPQNNNQQQQLQTKKLEK